MIGVCTGAIMLGLWMAVRELKTIAQRLGAGVPSAREATVRPVLPQRCARTAPGDGGFPFSRDQPAARTELRERRPAASPPPWQDEAAPRDRAPPEAAPAAAEAAAKPKRNLLFSSTSRKERERAQARTSEPLPPDLLSADLRPNPPAVPPPLEPAEPPPASFDDAWPKPERARPATCRRSGAAGAHDLRSSQRPGPNGAAGANEEPPAVTVLKSGVVDGMAYSLYSDGSIEAQMPEGMMRFASIDELRAHLDQRP